LRIVSDDRATHGDGVNRRDPYGNRALFCSIINRLSRANFPSRAKRFTVR
jgi:hypothetical protein